MWKCLMNVFAGKRRRKRQNETIYEIAHINQEAHKALNQLRIYDAERQWEEFYRKVTQPTKIKKPQRMTNAQAVDYVSNNDLW